LRHLVAVAKEPVWSSPSLLLHSTKFISQLYLQACQPYRSVQGARLVVSRWIMKRGTSLGTRASKLEPLRCGSQVPACIGVSSIVLLNLD
jgi:hypothetical protein